MTEFTYDSSHRLIDIKDPRGNIYLTNEYNFGGRVIEQRLADGSSVRFAYTTNVAGKIVQTDVTDPRGFVRRVTFDGKGYWLSDTRALGKPEQQTVTRERNATTHFVTSETDALGHRTNYAYDSFGNAQTVTRLAETANPVSTSAVFEPTFQRRTSLTDPLNHTTTYDYNAQGALTNITDQLSHGVTLTPNSSGNITGTADTTGTTQVFYTQGLVTRFVDAAGGSIERTLDAAGRPVSQTDPLGNRTTYEYTPLNMLSKVIDPLNGTTTFTYDPNGNLLSVKDARNGVTGYSYDQVNRVVSRTDALLAVERFTYDQSGNVRQHADRRGLITTYEYDSLNRLKKAWYADGNTTTYTYDNANRITQIVDSIAGTSTISYDPLGRLSGETSPRGSVTYTHDLADRRATMTVAGQPTITYGYDDADRLTSMTQGSITVTFVYDAANRRTATILPNGTSVEYGYDGASRLASLTYKKGSVVVGNLTYGYDAAGRRTEIGGTFARLTLPGAVSGATYNAANQLTQWQSTLLTYDANGNLLTHGVREFAWDARNRLEASGGIAASSFTYDAFGRRIGAVANGTSVAFLHDVHQIVQETSGGTVTANTLFGPAMDEALVRSDDAGQHGIFADGIGSVLALVDGAGDVEATYSYEPFGRTQATGNGGGNPLRFTGREADTSGLYYYRARYYDPMTQRFLSEDPSGFSAGPNLYAYVEGDPVSFRDPFGLQGKPDWTEIMKNIWNVGPYDAARAKQLADQSYSDAVKTKLYGPGNGLQDAYRHCLWSCRMAQELGANQARLIGDEHENAGTRAGQSPWERAMDEANNAAGRQCATQVDPEGKRRDCADTCMQLLRKGGLYGPGGIPFQVWLSLNPFR